MLKKEFVPYEQALALKELGFDEPCFATYQKGLKGPIMWDYWSIELMNSTNEEDEVECTAPTFSQAFRWFRDKYQIDSWIYPNLNGLYSVSIVRRGVGLGNVSQYQTYPEAELGCLIKLIEIVKNK